MKLQTIRGVCLQHEEQNNPLQCESVYEMTAGGGDYMSRLFVIFASNY